MTTPGGVPNLPPGALTLENLSSLLQDMTHGAVKGRAAERFSNIFQQSTGLDPMSDITPFGILTGIFAGFNSVVANADPADVDGPEDLPDLLMEFITGIPVVGQFVEILQAILGDYEGDDATLNAVQDIFGPIRALMELVSGGGLGSGFPALPDVTAGWDLVARAEDLVGVLRGDSPLPAWNLFGAPRPGLLSQVSLSSIGDFVPNLLESPLFDWSGAVDDPLDVWAVDTSTRHVDPARPETEQGNSVRLVADGATHDLMSDPELPVTPGQRVPMTVFVRWQGLVSTADPVRLVVNGYDAAGVEVLDSVIATAGAGLPADSVNHSDADADGWVELSATFIVPSSPAVASIRKTLRVTGAATAGTLWFSDASQSKTQRLAESFTEGLVEKLVGFDLDGFFDSSRLSGLLGQAQLDIPNVQDIVDRIVEGGGGSGVGNVVDTVRDRIGDIFDTANRADQNVIDVQASVQQLIDENNSGTAGNKNSVTFSGAEGSTLSGFTVGPNFDSIVIRDTDDSTVTAGIKSGLGNGRYWAVFDTTQYATDDQSVSAVFGKHGSAEISTTLVNRADPTMTNGAYGNVTTDQVTIGYWTRSGSTFTFNQLASVARTTKIGARVELRAIGTNYYVLINSVQVLAVTDTGNHVTIGSTNRSCGFVLARDTLGLFNTVHYSFWLASFAMADYAPAGGSTVASWHLTRSSTSSVSLSIAHGGVATLPSGFLTLEDSAVDAQVTNLGQGIVKVLKAGWYEIDATTVAGYGNYLFAPHWALFRNTVQATGPMGMGASKKVFLNANDTVQMGVVAVGPLPTTASTSTTTGEAPGTAVTISNLRGFASFSGRLVA